jgi:hypothetical protein
MQFLSHLILVNALLLGGTLLSVLASDRQFEAAATAFIP